MRRLALALGVVAVAAVLGSTPALADSEVLAESPACGYPRFYTPNAGRGGALPDSHVVRGPAGALFGRTVGQIRQQLVWWTVPMSGGHRVRVHRRLLPVLNDVTDNLAVAAAAGLHYAVRPAHTYGFSARTSVAHERISHHGLGAAIDVNSTTNPYRRDGVLVTDMPDWFVGAWVEAGMCWGGGWNGVKDPMHFSWNGPGVSPSYLGLPVPLAPLTNPAPFTSPAGEHQVVFAKSPHPTLVGEATGDGAPDVAQVRPWRDGNAVLEVATSRGRFEVCSVWRWWLGAAPAGTAHLADTQAMGRPDLVFVDDTGPTLTMRRYDVNDDYEQGVDLVTGVPSGERYVFGDADGDGADDLWAVSEVDGGARIRVWSAQSGYTEVLDVGVVPGLGVTASVSLAVADRDVDGADELLIVTPGAVSSVVVVHPGNLDMVAEIIAGPALTADAVVGFEDYDGDGRPDLVATGSGVMETWLGNSSLGGSATAWFVPDDFECDEDTVPYVHEGTFADDDESVFVDDVEWLAETGVTRGCNPPFQDRFCPDDPVTRGQMAAFLVRALGLAPASNLFTDDNDSVFQADIGALAAAGITRGCNPPVNDRFCPADPVTRGQMAAFLVRALGLAPAPNGFTDDNDSVFQADIGALAAAGVTRGCNPPVNDRFCPGDPVTRGQMAAFLRRASELPPAG